MREAEQLRKLTDYVKKNLKKGYTVDSLRWALIAQGYSRTAVEKSIEFAHKEFAAEAPVLKEKPTILHEVIGDDDMPVQPKRGFWSRLFGLE